MKSLGFLGNNTKKPTPAMSLRFELKVVSFDIFLDAWLGGVEAQTPQLDYVRRLIYFDISPHINIYMVLSKTLLKGNLRAVRLHCCFFSVSGWVRCGILVSATNPCGLALTVVELVASSKKLTFQCTPQTSFPVHRFLRAWLS